MKIIKSDITTAQTFKQLLLQMDAILIPNSDYIREFLIENGNISPDGDSPIKIEFDSTNFRCFVKTWGYFP